MTDAEFTETQQEILFHAWALAAKGHGQVVADTAIPEAEQLREAGWLERRDVTGTRGVAYFWTAQAETALDINELNQSVEGRQN